MDLGDTLDLVFSYGLNINEQKSFFRSSSADLTLSDLSSPPEVTSNFLALITRNQITSTHYAID